MVDDHEGLQAVALVAELDHPHAVSLLPAPQEASLSRNRARRSLRMPQRPARRVGATPAPRSARGAKALTTSPNTQRSTLDAGLRFDGRSLSASMVTRLSRDSTRPLPRLRR